MRRFLGKVVIGLAILAGFGLTIGPAGAQTVTFKVEGTNPGDNTSVYRGTVTLTQSGQVVRVVWKVGNDTSIGTGIIDGNTMAVGYPSGDEPGVALYSRDPKTGIVTGKWVPGGGRVLGTERWTPQ